MTEKKASEDVSKLRFTLQALDNLDPFEDKVLHMFIPFKLAVTLMIVVLLGRTLLGHSQIHQP